MANDIYERITFQVLARETFFVMKQLKIDEGKTDEDIRQAMKSSHQYKSSNHHREQRKSEKNIPTKEHLRLGRKL